MFNSFVRGKKKGEVISVLELLVTQNLSSLQNFILKVRFLHQSLVILIFFMRSLIAIATSIHWAMGMSTRTDSIGHGACVLHFYKWLVAGHGGHCE